MFQFLLVNLIVGLSVHLKILLFSLYHVQPFTIIFVHNSLIDSLVLFVNLNNIMKLLIFTVALAMTMSFGYCSMKCDGGNFRVFNSEGYFTGTNKQAEAYCKSIGHQLASDYDCIAALFKKAKTSGSYWFREKTVVTGKCKAFNVEQKKEVETDCEAELPILCEGLSSEENPIRRYSVSFNDLLTIRVFITCTNY